MAAQATQPAPIGPAVGSFTIADTASRWYDIDVTAYIEQLRVAGAGAMSVVIRQEPQRGRLAYINPSNHWTDDRPHLVITS